MNKAKSIHFRIKAKGNGIVNYDSAEQRFLFHPDKMNISRLYSRNDNVKYANKEFFVNEKGENDYKIVVSSACVGYEIYDTFKMDGPMTNYPFVYIPKLATLSGLLRGHMITMKDKDSFVRAKAANMTNFVQTTDNVSHLKIGNKSGERTTTSMFYKETVGYIEYEAKASIDLSQLQFIHLDNATSFAINPDDYHLFEKHFKSHSPEYNGKLGHYLRKTGNGVPIRGVMLNDELVKKAVRYFIERVYGVNIFRNGNSFEVSEVEYKIVNDPLVDKFYDEEGWTKIDPTKIDSFDFEMEHFYEEADSNSMDILETIEVYRKDTKEDREEKKQKDKEAKEARVKSKKA